MRIKKIIISLITILSMTFGCLSTIHANNNFSITASSTKGVSGDIVDIAIDVNNVPKLAGLQFKVEFDKELLDLIDINLGTIFSQDVNESRYDEMINQDKDVIFSYGYGLENITEVPQGQIAKLSFKIKEDVQIQEIKVSLTELQAYDMDLVEVPATLNDGKIDILCKHVFGERKIIKEPTCTESGLEEARCNICNEIIKNILPKLEHDFGDWIIIKHASETEEGLKRRECTVCHETEEKIITKIVTSNKNETNLENSTVKTTDNNNYKNYLILAVVSIFCISIFSIKTNKKKINSYNK